MSARAARELAKHLSDTTGLPVTATFDDGRWLVQWHNGPTVATMRALAAEHARSTYRRARDETPPRNPTGPRRDRRTPPANPTARARACDETALRNLLRRLRRTDRLREHRPVAALVLT
jgi:hypothetical protein